MPFSRRTLLRLLTALPLASVALPAFARRTPKATEGPFYPRPNMRFADADNDLVKIAGAVRDAGGEVMVLSGTVYTRDGTPAEGARVEIWQTDAKGVYLHTRDRKRGYDDAFQGFGHVVTGADGSYAFRTIKPVVYPGRTPHIHVKVRDMLGMRETAFFAECPRPIRTRFQWSSATLQTGLRQRLISTSETD